MSIFKVIQGKYSDVFKRLGLHCLLNQHNQARDFRTLCLDLNRTCYYSDHCSVSEIKTRLQTEFFNHGRENNTYLQGDLVAGLSQLVISAMEREELNGRTFLLSNNLNDIGSRPKVFSICYVNDLDELCALSILTIRDNRQDITPIINRPNYYVVVIYQNITALPTQRIVTLIAHPVLIDASINASTINTSNVARFINKRLKCKSLSALINPLFIKQGTEISLNAFKSLYSTRQDISRFNPNQNLDNSDEKLACLLETLFLRCNHSPSKENQAYLLDVLTEIKENPGYFQHISLDALNQSRQEARNINQRAISPETLHQLMCQVKHLNQPLPSFLQRHRLTLLNSILFLSLVLVAGTLLLGMFGSITPGILLSSLLTIGACTTLPVLGLKRMPSDINQFKLRIATIYQQYVSASVTIPKQAQPRMSEDLTEVALIRPSPLATTATNNPNTIALETKNTVV